MAPILQFWAVDGNGYESFIWFCQVCISDAGWVEGPDDSDREERNGEIFIRCGMSDLRD
jgi:hypothetical protein